MNSIIMCYLLFSAHWSTHLFDSNISHFMWYQLIHELIGYCIKFAAKHIWNDYKANATELVDGLDFRVSTPYPYRDKEAKETVTEQPLETLDFILEVEGEQKQRETFFLLLVMSMGERKWTQILGAKYHQHCFSYAP